MSGRRDRGERPEERRAPRGEGGGGACPAEETWLVYVDEALEPEAVRRVEAHLIGCERCRGLVLALREEGRLLADVLDERPAAAPAAVDEAPAAVAGGLALGMPLALLATAAVTAVGGTLLEARLPAGASWLQPTRLFGVPEMIFDLVFAVRDRAPGFLEFAVAVAAMASLAALVTFLASALARRVAGPAAMGLALLAALAPAPGARAALEIRGEESVHVREGEVFEGTLVAHGESVRIDGTVDGNVVVFTERLEIRGRVSGMVLAVTQDLDLPGEVDGTVVALAEELRLDGRVTGHLLAGAEQLRVGRDGLVGGDLAIGSADVEVAGRIGRDWMGGIDRLVLEGDVGRNLDLWVGRARLEDGARVGGDARLRAREVEDVEIDAGAVVAGLTDVTPRERGHFSPWARYADPAFYFWLLVRLGAAFAVGLLLHAIFPRLFASAVPTARDFALTLGKGFAVAVLAPAALVLLALTLVGLPAALIGLGLLLVAVYLAGILVAALIGRALTRPEGEGTREFGVALLVGLLLLAVASVVPGLGAVLRVVVVLVGLGLFLERTTTLVREAHARRRTA